MLEPLEPGHDHPQPDPHPPAESAPDTAQRPVLNHAGTMQGVQSGTIGQVHITHTTCTGSSPIALERYWLGVIPPPVKAFQHRAIAQQLRDAPATGGTVVLVGACSRVLCGMGGVGKTQIATEHTHHLWDSGAVDVVLWVNASSKDEILSAYEMAVTSELGPVRASKGSQSTQRMAQDWLSWLRSTTMRWLVVLDDVPAPNELNGLWPPHTETGQVIVTSRDRGAGFQGEGRQLISVDLFTPTESLDFLTARLDACTEQAEGAAELARALHHLPIALAQAAAYIYERPRMTCRTYLQRFTDRRTRLREIVPAAGELPDQHRDTLATVWALSIERANSLVPAGLAGPMLEITSLLEANGIPEALFTTTAVLDYLRSHSEDEVTQDTAMDALACLHRLHLITHDGDSTQAWVRIHALVQRATRESVSAEHLTTVARVAANALVQLWPQADRNVPRAAMMRSNANNLISHTESVLWEERCHPLLLRVNLSLGHSGQLFTAISHARKLLAKAEDQLGVDHPSTLTIRCRLAHWQGEADEPVHAIHNLHRVLADRTRVLGPDHPDTLATRHNLANRHGACGDPDGAARAFALLLADRVRVLGAEHPDTLSSLNNVAYWQEEAGALTLAITNFQKLVRLREKALGEDHPDTLTAVRNLAFAHHEAGQFHHAALTYQLLLTRLVRSHSDNEEEIVMARADMAGCLAQGGDHVVAAAGFARLLADIEPLFGPDHPDTLTVRHNLAWCRGHAGDVAAAVAELDDLLRHMQRLLGDDHPECLPVRANLAEFLGRAGNVTAAIAMLYFLVADMKGIVGRAHPDLLATRSNLAHWLGRRGDVAEAIATLREALEDAAATPGPDHLGVLTTRINLSHWLATAGDTAAAKAILVEALEKQETLLGAEHPATQITRAELGRLPGGPGPDSPGGARSAVS